MASEKPSYTVSELEQLTGISRRTIHFYVKEGVIAPPDGIAGGARYGEEHLLRLQLTRELQKSHLKLSGIREAMDRLSLEQMRLLLHKAESSARSWDQTALERWLEQRVASIESDNTDTSQTEGPGVAESEPVYDPHPESDGEPASAWNRSFLDIAGGSEETSAGSGNQAGRMTDNTEHALTPQSWERVEIADGFEVLVRSDRLASYQQVLRELVRLVGQGR